MTSTDNPPVSTAIIGSIYMAWYLGYTLLFGILVHFVFQSELKLSVFLVLPALAGHMTALYWRKREKAAPTRGRAWAYAFFCGTSSTMLLLVLVVAGVLGDDGSNWFWLAMFPVWNIVWTKFGFSAPFRNPPCLPKEIMRVFRIFFISVLSLMGISTVLLVVFSRATEAIPGWLLLLSFLPIALLGLGVLLVFLADGIYRRRVAKRNNAEFRTAG